MSASGGSTDSLRFQFFIEKKGDIAFINQIGTAIEQAFNRSTASTTKFSSTTASSMNQIKSAVQNAIPIYDSLGAKVAIASKNNDNFGRSLSGIAGPMGNLTSHLMRGVRSIQDYEKFTKAAVTSGGQFDASLRRQAASMNQGHTAATRYSAIFKQIQTAQAGATASTNANSSAISTNAQRLLQNDNITRNAIANTTKYTSVLQQESSAINQLTSNVDKLASSQIRSQQALMSNVRTSSTFIMGVMMMSQSIRDFQLNQESMADLQDKISDATERYTMAVQRWGEESYMAQQALGSLEKAQRAVRYEQREMANQIGNQIFLFSMIASNVVMEVIPALQNWESTSTKLRSGFSRLGGAIAGLPTIFTAFARGADRSADAVSNIGKNVEPTNRGISILSSNFDTTSDRAGKFGKALTAAETAGNKFRGGLTRMVGLIGGAGGGAIGAGLIAAGVGLALYSNNTNGARDAVNSFGETIGKINPVLKGIGDGLVGVASSLGLTGETATQTREHFNDMNTAFDDAGKGWHDMVQGMLSDGNAFIQMAGMMAEAVGMLANPQDIIPKVGDPSKGTKNEDMTNTSNWLTGEKTGTGSNDNISPSDLISMTFDENGKPQFNQMITGDPITDEAITSRSKWNALMARSQDLLDGFYSEAQQNTPEYLQAEKDNVYYQGQIKDKYYELITTAEQYDQVLQTLEKRKELERNGYNTGVVLMREQALELINNNGLLKSYEEALGGVTLKANAQIEGQQKQRQAYIDQALEVQKLIGQNMIYEKQLKDGKILTDAYALGVQKQILVQNEQTRALSENQGVLDQLNNQIVEGTALTNAYTEGQQKQQKTLYDTVLAASNAQGVYQQLGSQIEKQTITNAAWNKGLAEGRVATLHQIVALSEAAGSLQAYNESIASGAAQTIAYTQGALEMTKATAEAFVNIDKSRGALEAYTSLISKGIPQYNAYNQAVIDQKMAFQETAVEIASLQGTTDTFFAGITEYNNVVNMMSKAFEEGRSSIKDFATELYTAGMSSAGVLTQLDVFSNILGYDLPNNFKLTEDSAKGLVKAFSGIPGVIKQIASESHAAGMGMLDGVITAFQEGGKEVNENLEDLEEKIGVDFPESVKDSLETAGLGQAMANNMTEVINIAQAAWDNGADKFDVTSMVDKKAQEWMDEWDKQGVEMTAQTDTIFDTIRQTISEGPEEGPNGMSEYLAKLNGLFTAAAAASDPLATSIAELSQFDFGPAIQSLQSYGSSLDGIVESFKNVNLAINDVNDAMAGMVTTPGDQSLNESGPSGKGSGVTDIDTEAKRKGLLIPEGMTEGIDQATIDTAIQSLDQLKAKTDEVMASMLATVGTTMGQIATVTNTVFTGMMGLLADNYGKMIEISTTSFTAIGEQAFQVTVGVTKHYNQAALNADGVLKIMETQAAPHFTTIGESAFNVTVGVTKHYNQAALNADGVLNIMEQHAQASFDAQGESAIAVSQGVSTHFSNAKSAGESIIGDLESAVKTSFQNMADAAGKVADAIDAIGDSANDAEKDVDSLKSAVESLPDIERTITYRIRTVGSAPSGASVAQGTPGIFNMAEGGQLFDIPNKTVITGESGDEFVRLFDKFGNVKEQIVKDIKAFTLKAGEGIQVQPLQGFYAQQFQAKYGNIIDMATGGNIMVPPGEGFGVSPGALPNTASGPISLSPDTRIYTWEDGGKPYTISQWNNTNDMGRTNMAESNDAGIKYIPEDIYLNEDYSLSHTNSGTYAQYVRNTTWESGPNAGQPSDAYNDNSSTGNNNNETGSGFGTNNQLPTVTNPKDQHIGSGSYLGSGEGEYYRSMSGYYVPDYVQSGGHGATDPAKWSSPNMNPNTWKAVPMTDKQYKGLWKVVDDKGINIYAKLKSKEEAEEIIQEHIIAANGGVNPNMPNNGGDTSGNPTTGGNVNGGSTQTNNQSSNGGNNYNYQNSNGNINQSGQFPPAANSTGQSVYDPYNRNLTASQWGKSYLGGGMWYDPLTGTFSRGFMGSDGLGGGGGIGTGGSGMSGSPTQTVTTPDGRIIIQQGAGGQKITIDGNVVLDHGSTQSFTDAVNDFSNSVGGNGGGGSNVSSGIQQSQIVSQSSTIGQGNNSNLMLQSGTNSSLVMQNGKVIEATGIYAGFGNNGGETPGGIGSGKIRNLDFGPLNVSGIAGSTPTSVYNNISAKNDPTGIFNYDLLPDPIFREIPTRSLLPRVGGNKGTSGKGGGLDVADLFDIKALLKQILNAIGATSNMQFNINDEPFLNIVKGKLLDGYDNFK